MYLQALRHPSFFSNKSQRLKRFSIFSLLGTYITRSIMTVGCKKQVRQQYVQVS